MISGAKHDLNRMKRRLFLLSSSAILSAAATRSLAQQVPAPKRVGGLYANSAEPTLFRSTFESRLRELGWIEGKNLMLVNRFANGDLSRLDSLASEIAAQKVDVIHALLISPVRAARKANPDTPIVFSIISDPVADGLVASLARPGGNITGASTREWELFAKRLQLVKDLLPRAKRVTILVDAPPASGRDPRYQASLDDLAKTGEKLGLRVEYVLISSATEVGPAFDRAARERVDAVIAMLYFRLASVADRRLVVENAARVRIPAIYVSSSWVDLGGLATYAQNLPELGRRAANYVDRILRGAKPADLPVEEPNAFELVINLKTARAIGLPIPQSLLLRADRVIE